MTSRFVLVIDDNRGDADLLVEAFAEVAPTARVVVAPSVAEAVSRSAAGTKPALIVTDHGLPGMSGDEVLSALSASPSLRDVPVVILSGSPQAIASAELPIDDWIVKAPTYAGSLHIAGTLAMKYLAV
ncbi:MAG TPA: response regulator [Planctomycetota bacterium]|nr:response regulator [Planctomycetota bacterium]